MENSQHQLQITSDKKEIKEHGSYAFPVRVSYESLSMYNGAFLWHWHPEIELTLVLEGEISYRVNEKRYRLQAGDGLFCNCNALHTGESIGGKDCRYLSITFLPRVLYGEKSSVIYTRFVRNLCGDGECSSIHFRPDDDWQSQLLASMEKIRRCYDSHPKTMELEIQIELLSIWLRLYRHWADTTQKQEKESDPNQERIRVLLAYIQEHYSEKLTLEDLAAQIHICKNECCRMFKKYMHETLFSYLLAYRVNQSLVLLSDTDLEITEIAEKCGFANPGYYTRVFKRIREITPMGYRKKCRENKRLQGGSHSLSVL